MIHHIFFKQIGKFERKKKSKNENKTFFLKTEEKKTFGFESLIGSDIDSKLTFENTQFAEQLLKDLVS